MTYSQHIYVNLRRNYHIRRHSRFVFLRLNQAQIIQKNNNNKKKVINHDYSTHSRNIDIVNLKKKKYYMFMAAYILVGFHTKGNILALGVCT